MRHLISLISIGLFTVNVYAGFYNRSDERLALLDEEIRTLEKKYTHLGARDHFSKTGDHSFKIHVKGVLAKVSPDHQSYNVNKFVHAENCFIAAATEIYDADGNLVQVEEGPINLRQVEKINIYPFVSGESLAHMLSFDAPGRDLPELYFENEESRSEAFKIISRLLPLCHERYKLFTNLYPEPPPSMESLAVPSSSELGARPVRYHQDDPTMRAALLIDGREAFGTRLEIAGEATRPGDSILLQTLIFMADEAGLRISDELIRRRKMGVRVEVSIDALSPFLDVRDALGVRKNTKTMYSNLMAAGIPVYGWRCGLKHHLIEEIKKSVSFKQEIYDQRPHEKIFIVNKRKAIVGGLNIGNDYFRLNKKGFNYWRDQDVYLEGDEIIQDLVNIFEGNTSSYIANYKDPRKDFCFNPYDPVTEGQQYQEFLVRNTSSYILKRFSSDEREKKAHALSVIQEIERTVHETPLEQRLSFEPLEAARAVHNRPKLRELHIEQVYLDLINRARNEVLIENAYLIPSEPIKKALRRAAHRGIRVMMITNSYQTNDVPPVAVLSRHGYKELVDSNYFARNGKRPVEIYEWTGEFKESGVMEQGTNHSKFIIVDRSVMFIGSYNLDPRSRNINSEIGIVFKGLHDELGRRLAQEFHEVDLSYSRRVPYRDIVSYRKPLNFWEGLKLDVDGYKLKHSILDIGVKDFFFTISRYDEGTW